MTKGFLLSILCLTSFISAVVGSAVLVPKLSTAKCKGHFENVTITSITCDYSQMGCTYGSEVFVTGQVYVSGDVPRPMNVKMSRTFPSFYAIGTNVYKGEVGDVCYDTIASNIDDDEYGCPNQGQYNFHFKFNNFGSRQKWYAGWHGYSMGMIVHFKHESGGKDYATCTIDVKVESGDEDEYSYATNASFVSVAVIGLAGMLTGLFVSRRKEKLESNQQIFDDKRMEESNTDFELINDPSSVVV